MDILLVEDDESSCSLIAQFLTQLGHRVVACHDGETALTLYGEGDFPMVLTDIQMPRMSGLDLLRAITAQNRSEQTCVVLFTGHGDMESAVAALRAGAYDYLLKPINIDELAAVINRVMEFQRLRRENRILTQQFDAEVAAATMETNRELSQMRELLVRSLGLEDVGIFSAAMRQIVEEIKLYHANRAIPVLIEGETGTGKELLARLVHYGDGQEAPRAPFIDVNCAAFQANLFESELFGYESGTFTGGLRSGRRGKLDLAQGGTLFLDEVGDLPLDLQAKLLRVLQEKEYYRVGGLKKITADVRLVCATNADLETKIREGSFRKDLYYRLAVGRIVIPPLRERREEVMPLARMFLQQFARKMNRQVKSISDGAAQLLNQYFWPGNVRELRNLMEWVTVMFPGTDLLPEQLQKIVVLEPAPAATPAMKREIASASVPSKPGPLEATAGPLSHRTDAIILETLTRNRGNKTATARELGISVRNLYYRLEKMK
ncbi:MAG TPA: sigma-54 dependent transcriptional regulator [Patescibacteria group bacterium]|nr:sigma-54 dependent transcriptional regulator [Patescibacteria group bacterium]